MPSLLGDSSILSSSSLLLYLNTGDQAEPSNTARWAYSFGQAVYNQFLILSVIINKMGTIETSQGCREVQMRWSMGV